MSVHASVLVESPSHKGKNVEASQEEGCVITRKKGRCVLHDDEEDSGFFLIAINGSELGRGEKVSVTH